MGWCSERPTTSPGGPPGTPSHLVGAGRFTRQPCAGRRSWESERFTRSPPRTSPGSDDLRDVLALGHTSDGPAVVGYWGATGAGVALAGELGCVGAAGDLNIDGSLGSRTARLSTPYADAPSDRGYLYRRPRRVDRARCRLYSGRAPSRLPLHRRRGCPLAVAAMTRAAERCGLRRGDCRSAPSGTCRDDRPDLVDDMARLGVVASVQPRFDEYWGGDDGMYAARLGCRTGENDESVRCHGHALVSCSRWARTHRSPRSVAGRWSVRRPTTAPQSTASVCEEPSPPRPVAAGGPLASTTPEC